jgi:hypothetical protein
MTGGTIRGWGYVITDDSGNLIAVVRPAALRRPRRIPRWADDKDTFVTWDQMARGGWHSGGGAAAGIHRNSTF